MNEGSSIRVPGVSRGWCCAQLVTESGVFLMVEFACAGQPDQIFIL